MQSGKVCNTELGDATQDCCRLTQLGKVHFQCEQERKKRNPIEKVEG